MPPLEARRAPFAIGVVVAVGAGGAGGRRVGDRADRMAVALAAWRAGFFLLDTIEVDADEPVTGPGWGEVWALAAATDADRLFAYGVDADELEPMAGELRLLVRRVDTEGPMAGEVEGWAAAGVLAAARSMPGPAVDESGADDPSPSSDGREG